MSQPGREFRLEWNTSVNDFTVRVSIYESDFLIADDETPEVIDLLPSANPLIFSTIDNDRNKFTPVRAKQAKISFESGNFDITTFFDAPDNRWLVVITLPDAAVELFRGYLVLSDLSQPFLPDPVTVTLTATDKLGTLKDVALVNYLGEVPTGKILISYWLSHICRLTGMDLDFKVQYNVREIDSNDFHLFWKNYLDALTFEDEVGSLIDAYEAARRILFGSAFITQYKGEWWIKRVDEFENTLPDYVASFDHEGTYVSIDNGVGYVQNVGPLVTAKWINADQIVSTERPHDNIKLRFNYDYPKEIPCNNDLERGDYVSDIDSDTKKYELDCWDLFQNDMLTTATDNTAFIQREFNSFDVEEERFAVIDVGAIQDEYRLRSQQVEVKERDKLDFSFQVKHNGQIETAAGFVTPNYAQIHLHAHDGTFYTLDGGFDADGSKPEWVACTSTFTTFQQYFKIQFDGTEDDTQWRGRGFENGDCPPCPKDGYLYVVFVHNAKSDEFQLHIGSVNFTIYPYINGSYRKFTAQQHKQNRTDAGYKPSIDEQVYMSDAPHPIIKGAIFKFDSGVSRYILGTQYYDHTESPLAVPPTVSGKLVTFGKLQAIDFWNQYKTGCRVLEGTFHGFTESNPPDVIHRYIFTNTDPNINGKTFMCVGFEQNWKTEQCRASFIEVYRNAVGRTYTDPYEFKYLSS